MQEEKDSRDHPRQEMKTSALKILLAAVPVAGPFLTEALFEYRGRLKQERLNDFTKVLAACAEKYTDIPIENFQTEDFSDLLESVLRRVTLTKSRDKQRRFRDILLHQLQHPEHPIDHAETYLDLISSLSEMDLIILKAHEVFDGSYEQRQEALRTMQSDLTQKQDAMNRQLDLQTRSTADDWNQLEQEAKHLRQSILAEERIFQELAQRREAMHYRVDAINFQYSKQHLYNKGLLIDSGIGSIGGQPFIVMSITEFGKRFLSDIEL